MRYVCLHGHFYQPPRENPWLESIERQESASPYHDWNERINAECYAPNAFSRILDGEGCILRIVNNYGKVSFNFGATLLDWMRPEAPDTYEAILEADRRSRKRFGGHGSAIAQAYGHLILPLTNSRDKRTQVTWGIRDFESRFERKPEGMWLAETAVDVEGLEIMAEAGIAYTILAPHQAGAVRREGRKEWQDVSGARIDPTRPYRIPLPSGRSITVFFYDGPISRGVAFERLLENGAKFVERLMDGFTHDDGDENPLVHIATDGETYGHHHTHGEMALSYALQQIEERMDVDLINYGAYLERFPPTWEAQIIEDTSWSCVHGIERWRSDCGCNSGGNAQWNQAWRAPLRDALDWLRDEIEPGFERMAGELFHDPWEAREEYIEVILDRSSTSIDRFYDKVGKHPPDDAGRVRGLKLMELQRQAMMMYTSCGWFFDELSGIETVQVIQYAGRVVQLAEELTGESIEDGFLDRLERAKSNLRDKRDGRRIYHLAVEPARVDLPKVGAHYAVSSMFEAYEEENRVYCYTVEQEHERALQSGRNRLALGRVRITSEITRENGVMSYGVLHLGDHNVIGGVRPFQGIDSYDRLADELQSSFSRADYPAVIRILDRSFLAATYSLRSLFRDEQRRILDRILEPPIREAEATYSRLYQSRAPLMRFVADLGIPQPKAFRIAAEHVLNVRLERVLLEEMPNLPDLRSALDEAEHADVRLDPLHIGHAARSALERLMHRLALDADDEACLGVVEEAIDLIPRFPFDITLWGVQNSYWAMLQSVYPERSDQARQGDGEAARWVERFRQLGEKIAVAPPAALS